MSGINNTVTQYYNPEELNPPFKTLWKPHI